ncbi:MAG: coproporphyrinogen dehydrogenase HemZ [Clostridia bacterium]|nr:coproporphyrinogen dehydrogenase HemZ [Clostridia bacterium]
MKLEIIGHDFRFDCENMCMLFFPNTKFAAGINDGREVKTYFDGITASAEFTDVDGKKYLATAEVYDILYDKEKAAVKTAMFKAFSEATGIRPPWGILTGIRPVSFWLKMCEMYGEKAAEVLEKYYLVIPQKIRLCIETSVERAETAAMCKPDTVSLYVSIPFCPTRCKYCSFVSGATEKEHRYIPKYLEVLSRELSQKAELIRQREQKLQTIYIGGGTPSILSAEQLDLLIGHINKTFDFSNVCEFTVEAGRPDTITEDKISVLAANGVSRVSVNPQTLNDDVLRIVGRKHTVADFYRAYEIVAKTNMSVNVDLIAGLPGENAEGFADGVSEITALSPDNITVHSLYVKRAADYGMDGSGKDFVCAGADEGTKMITLGSEILHNNGYFPYYLYRQKNTVGNNENTGYAKHGKECKYNILMMDDLQTIYGCGAGGMTKIVEGTHIERLSNTKFAYNYIEDGI